MVTRSKQARPNLRLLAFCLLAGCLVNVGFDVFGSVPELNSPTYLHVREAHSLEAPLYTELSEGQNETMSRFSIPQAALNALSYDVLVAARPWRSPSTHSRVHIPLLTTSDDLVIRKHQFVI